MPLLFSYGTLRYDKVQQDTFGRLLETREALLPGYALDKVEISDPAVLASSGERFHPIIRPVADHGSEVNGVVVVLTDKELAAADSYEVEDYRRTQVTLASGEQAWAYVDARYVPSVEENN